MILLVSDTSVLIDLERCGLLPLAFGTGVPMVVPDVLYGRELAPYQGPHYRALGLQVVALTPDEVAFAQAVRNEHRKLSVPDCFALACARRPDHILLSGDGLLRTTAKDKGVTCYGLLWLLDALDESDAGNRAALHTGLAVLAQDPRCRLPRAEVARRLALWQP